MAFLELDRISKSFGTLQVVRPVSLEIDQGEFVTLLGPSGCGKTTILRMVAGFETPTSGAIRIDGKDVVGLRPNQRNVGMVFQAYALFPNLTVAQNVGFGLKVAGVPKAQAEPRIAEMLALIGLPDLGGRYPFQLSGGQQQRVALARALANRPKMLLLDEPLSALDAKVRVSLREEIRRIQKELGITTIFVTHDQEEALSMSDRIVVMNTGVVEQVGTPSEVYNRPSTVFVSTFVGQISKLSVTVADPVVGLVRLGQQSFPVGRPLEFPAGSALTLALRPEMIALGPGSPVTLGATVDDVSFLGAIVRVRLNLDGQALSVDLFNTPTRPPPKPGDRVEVGFDPAHALIAVA
jgi:putative spermidine/putrescine transport system ATP-binding protein